MASFAKDITTPINIPEVQAPDFSANRSNVQDFATIVTTGLAINDRIEAKDKEIARQTVEKDMNKFVDTLVSDFLNNSQQQGGRTKALRTAQKQIVQRGSPLQSGFINKAFGERLKVLEQGVDFTQKSAKTQDAFSVSSTDTQSEALAMLGINNVPEQGSQERDQLNTAINKITTIGVSYDTNKKIAENAANISQAQVDDLDISARSVMSTKGEPLVTKMTQLIEQSATAPADQRAAVFKGLRDNVNIFRGVLTDFVDDTFSGIPSTKVIKNKEEMLKEVDRLLKPFEDTDEAAMTSAANNLQFLSSELQMGLFNASNSLALVKAAYGQAVPELTWSFIQDNQKLAKDLEEAVEITLGLTNAQKQAMTLNSLHEYINGGGTIDEVGAVPLSPEQKAKIYETSFKFMKSQTRDGALLNLEREDANKVSDSMIHILQDASSKDATTSNNIMSWANDPNFQQVLGKVDTEKADAIRNMIITKSKESIRVGDGTQSTINRFPDLYTFDLKTGKYSLTDKGTRLPTRIGTGLLAGTGPISKPDAVKAMNRANRDVSIFLKNAPSNPALSGLNQQQQLSWLMKEGSGVPLSDEVTTTGGTFLPTSEVESEAIDQQISVQELEKQRQVIADRASIPNQVLELQEEIKSLRDSGVTKGDPDVEDLDDEEFEEFIKLERKRRGSKN